MDDTRRRIGGDDGATFTLEIIIQTYMVGKNSSFALIILFSKANFFSVMVLEKRKE